MRIAKSIIATVVALSATGCKDDAPTAPGAQGSSASSNKAITITGRGSDSRTESEKSVSSEGPSVDYKDNQFKSVSRKGRKYTDNINEELVVYLGDMVYDETVMKEFGKVLLALNVDIEGLRFTEALKFAPEFIPRLRENVSNCAKKAAAVDPAIAKKIEAEAQMIDSLLTHFGRLQIGESWFNAGKKIKSLLDQLYQTEGRAFLSTMAEELRDVLAAGYVAVKRIAWLEVDMTIRDTAREFAEKHPKYRKEMDAFAQAYMKMVKNS